MSSAARVGALLFGACYFALIAGSIHVVKESTALSEILIGFRVAMMLGVALLWVSVNAMGARLAIGVILTLTIIAVYSLSGIYAQASDIAILIVTADLLLRQRNLDRRLCDIAKYSIFFATAIAVLAVGAMIPAPVHESESITKASLGYWNPNTYYLYAFSSAIVFFVLKREGMFWFCLAMIGVFATFGGSRTYLIGAGLLGLTSILLRPGSSSRIAGVGSLLAYSVAAIVGVVSSIYVAQLATMFEVLSGKDLNQLLSRRIEILERVSSERDVASLWIGGVASGTDSTYEYLASAFGLPFLCALLLLVFAAMVKYCQERSPRITAALAIVALVGLFEVVVDGSLLLSLFVTLLTLRKLSHVDLTGSSRNASTAPF